MPEPRPSAEPPISAKVKVIAFALAAIASLLVLESAIRIADMRRGHGFFASARNLLIKAEPVRPFRTFGTSHYVERDGEFALVTRHGEIYPLDKPPGTTRIVCFGGSTTENEPAFEEAGIHYPLVLEQILRERLGRDDIEVLNVAHSGYSTAHSLILLELDVISWQPDVVILSHNSNDQSAGWWPGFRYDYSQKYSHEFYLPDHRSLYSVPNVLFQHSRLYWMTRKMFKALEGFPAPRRKSYGPEPPAATLHVFRRNVESFITIARSRGIRVVLGTQPLESSEEMFLAHMSAKPYNDIVTYPLHDEFVRHHRRYNDAILEVAAQQGVLSVDVDVKLGGERRYFVDHVHYTPAGVEALAAGYAEALIEAGLVE